MGAAPLMTSLRLDMSCLSTSASLARLSAMGGTSMIAVTLNLSTAWQKLLSSNLGRTTTGEPIRTGQCRILVRP